MESSQNKNHFRRDNPILVYLSVPEKERLFLKAQRSGMSMSDFIRFVVFREQTIKKKLDKILDKLEEFE